jgi:hypothetical protein
MIHKVKENKTTMLFVFSRQYAVNIPKRTLSKPDGEEIRTKISARIIPYQCITGE